jgi:hypothetical protein
MSFPYRLAMTTLVLVFGTGLLLAPLGARASEEGRRNTALALGTAAGVLLVTQKNKTPGILAALGAAYAYKTYDDAIRERHKRERYGYYDDRYDRYDYRYGRDRRDWHRESWEQERYCQRRARTYLNYR